MTTVVNTTFTDTYAAVLQFYARQVQLLDSGRFEEYAATFTADGEFQHTPTCPPRARRPASSPN